MKGRRTQVMLYLDPSAADELRALKAATRIPMQELLREAVADLLKKHARELRKAKS